MTDHQEGTANYAPRAYRRFRQIVIYISFILVIVWLIYVISVAYKDPQVLCGTDPTTNWLSLCTLGVAIIGGITYYFSSDLQLKVKSQLRRLPALWAASIDSSYTPYFNPEHYIIENGHYVRVQNNLFDSDNVGLPIVDEKTPLNSFNMRIYKRYWGSILDSNKRWKEQQSENNFEAILREHIMQHSRIVMVGHSCMIVKAYSGEHLLIHKSQYNDFMRDQINNTPWMSVNRKRKQAIDENLQYVDGIAYFAKKINNSREPLSIADSKTQVGKYYNKLVNELAMVAFYGRSKDSGILDFNEIIDALINLPTIPYSITSISKNLLSLRMEELAAVSPLQIQNLILSNKTPDNIENQTATIFDSIRMQLINQDILNKYRVIDPKIVEAKSTMEANIKAPLETLNLTLDLISQNIRDEMDKNPTLTILPTLVQNKNSPLGILVKDYQYEYSKQKRLKDAVNTTTATIKSSLTMSQKTRDQIANTNATIMNELHKTGKIIDKVSAQNLITMMAGLKQAANNSIEQFRSSDALKKAQTLKQNFHNLSLSSENKYQKLTGPTVDMIHNLHKEVTNMESQLDATSSSVSNLESNLIKSNSNILLKTSETEKLLQKDESLRKEIESISAAFDSKLAERDGIESKAKHIEESIVVTEKELQGLNKQGPSKITDGPLLDAVKIKEAQLNAAKLELNQVLSGKAKLNLLIQSLRNDLDKKRLELEANIKVTKEQQGVIESLRVEHEELRNNFATQSMQLANIGSKYSELVAMNEKLQMQLEQEHKEKEAEEKRNLSAIAKMNQEFQNKLQQQYEEQKANQEKHNTELKELQKSLQDAQLASSLAHTKNEELQRTLDNTLAQRDALQTQKAQNDKELSNLQTAVDTERSQLSEARSKYDQTIASLKLNNEQIAAQLNSSISQEQRDEFLRQKDLLQQQIATLEEQSMQEQEKIQRLLDSNLAKQTELVAKNEALAGKLQQATDLKDQYYAQLMESQRKSSVNNTEIARLNNLITHMEENNTKLTERLLEEKAQELQAQKERELANQRMQYEATLMAEQKKAEAAARATLELEEQMQRNNEMNKVALEAQKGKLMCSETKRILSERFSFNHQIKLSVTLSSAGKFIKRLFEPNVFDAKFVPNPEAPKEIILNKITLKHLLDIGILFEKMGENANKKVQQDYNAPLHDLYKNLSELRKLLYDSRNDVLILKSMGGNMLCLFFSIYHVLNTHPTINKLLSNMDKCQLTGDKNLLMAMIINILEIGDNLFKVTVDPNRTSTLGFIIRKFNITVSSDQNSANDTKELDELILTVLMKLCYHNHSDKLSYNTPKELHSYSSSILNSFAETGNELLYKFGKTADEIKFNTTQTLDNTTNTIAQKLQPATKIARDLNEARKEMVSDVKSDQGVPPEESLLGNLLGKAQSTFASSAEAVTSFVDNKIKLAQNVGEEVANQYGKFERGLQELARDDTGLTTNAFKFLQEPLPPTAPSGTKNVSVIPSMQTSSGIKVNSLIDPNFSFSSVDNDQLLNIYNDLYQIHSSLDTATRQPNFEQQDENTKKIQTSALSATTNNMNKAFKLIKMRNLNRAKGNTQQDTAAHYLGMTTRTSHPSQ